LKNSLNSDQPISVPIIENIEINSCKPIDRSRNNEENRLFKLKSVKDKSFSS